MNKQVIFLQSLGWWDEIKGSTSNSRKVLKHARALNVRDFSLSIAALKSFQKDLLNVLDQATIHIVDAVETTLQGTDTGVHQYAQLQPTIAAYLQHGVVPSTIVEVRSKAIVSPDPITILNVAYQLCLDDLSLLIDRIEGESPDSVEDRTRWTQRLESWTLKALDDLELVSMQPRTHT